MCEDIAPPNINLSLAKQVYHGIITINDAISKYL